MQVRSFIPAACAIALACSTHTGTTGSPLDPKHVSSDAQLIPTRYFADRFFATPVTPAGDTIAIFLDTGGGTLMWDSSIPQLGLAVDSVKTSSGAYRHVVSMPVFRADRSLPPIVTPSIQGDKLLVASTTDPKGFGALISRRSQAQLGRLWFYDRIWTFDYPNHRLLLNADQAPSLGAGAHSMSFDFQSDSLGKPLNQAPRVDVVIDGDSLKMLFDTGATIWLTPDALAWVNDGLPDERATTHVSISLYKKWRARHPDWRVIEHGDKWSNSDLMIVPSVRVAGFDVGPALFSALLDDTASTYVQPPSRTRIDGTLGGSVLRYFTVTVDYPRRTASFLPARR